MLLINRQELFYSPKFNLNFEVAFCSFWLVAFLENRGNLKDYFENLSKFVRLASDAISKHDCLCRGFLFTYNYLLCVND